MTTPSLESQPTAPPAPSAAASRRHLEEIVLVVLVLLSGLGVAISDSSPQKAFSYWLWMAPVFGVVSALAAWSRASRRGEPVGRIVPVQILHWLGVVAAMYLVYLLLRTGRMTNEAAGSSTLVVLALGSFLAGVYGDWRMALLGVALGVTAVGFAIVEQFVWLIAIPALAIGVIALIIYMRRG